MKYIAIDKYEKISEVRKASQDVKALSRVKSSRKGAERHHGYKVKPNEIESRLQRKSVSKANIKGE